MPLKNIVTEQPVTKEKLERANELRREMTLAEKLLWQEVRAKKLGVRIRRQQVIQGFIVDFYCHKAALVIEVGLRPDRFYRGARRSNFFV
jgi:very-short-patch-repair endonuclease